MKKVLNIIKLLKIQIEIWFPISYSFLSVALAVALALALSFRIRNWIMKLLWDWSPSFSQGSYPFLPVPLSSTGCNTSLV